MSSHGPLIRIGAWSGIAAILWDLGTLAFLTIATGVDPIHDYLSVIRLTPWGGWYIAAGTIAVLLHLPFVVALWLVGGGPRHLLAGLLGVFFVFQWSGAALFPCDPGCELITATGKTHYALGVAGFVCLGLAGIGYGILHGRAGPLHKPVAALTIVSVTLALGLLTADLVDAYKGIMERLSLLAFGAWTIVLAWRLRAFDDYPQLRK